jgi:hypothetical protein
MFDQNDSSMLPRLSNPPMWEIRQITPLWNPIEKCLPPKTGPYLVTLAWGGSKNSKTWEVREDEWCEITRSWKKYGYENEIKAWMEIPAAYEPIASPPA